MPASRRTAARTRASARGGATAALHVIVSMLLLAAVAATVTPPASQAAFIARPSPGTGGSTYNPAAELMWGNDTLHVAWTNATGDAPASTWNGAWSPLPMVGMSGSGRRTDPSVAWGGGRLWGGANNGADEPIFKSLSGGTWTALPSVAPPNNGVWSVPSVAHDGTVLWAAWQDAARMVRVATWNGTSWTNVTSPGGGNGNAYPDLEYNEATGTMWITFNQGGMAPVREWVSGAWVDRGSLGDGAGNKIPGMTDINGTVVVSWDDDPNHEARTHVRVGGAWHEIDSHKPGTSTSFAYPDLAWTGTSLWASNTADGTGTVATWEWDGAPLLPVDRRQLRADGTTTIPAGGATNDGVSTDVNLRFTLVSVAGAQVATPWIEIRPSSTAFSAGCGSTVAGATFSGPTVSLASAGQAYGATVAVSGLTAGVEYHWRACARAGTLPSSWAADSVNQRFTVSAPPAAPSTMFAGDASAATGSANPTTITQDDFRLSWRNDASTSVDRQRVQVLTTPLTDVIGLWHLDGSAADASGNGHTGSLDAGPADPAYVAGRTGFAQALEFDGNDQASIPWHPSFDDQTFTVDAWFNWGSSITTWETIAAKTSSEGVRHWGIQACHTSCAAGSGGIVAAYFTHSGGTRINLIGTTPVDDGGWHHVALVSTGSGGTMSLYVDGVLEASRAIPAPLDTGADDIRVGYRLTGNHLTGSVDELRLTSRPLSQAEIGGYHATRRPHFTTMWDSDATDAGVALGASCAAAARCADVAYGSSGTPSTPLVYDGARYYARSKLRTAATGIWSGWSSWDWFETMNSTTLSTGGCSGVALDLGSIVGGIPSITTGDCAIGFGSTGTSTQLRIYQTDQVGTAASGAGATPGIGTIDDYAPGVSDLDQGASMFGACLRAVTNATADWSVDATCPATDGAWWNAVPASPGAASSNVVHTTGAEPAAVARLRFAVRVDGTIAPGGYAAPVTIEVVDPVP